LIKELEDYSWFPSILRRFQLDYIGFVVRFFHLYKPLVPILKNSLEHKTNWVDLCSGSGEPALYLSKLLNKPINLVLSDKFPTREDIQLVDILEMNFEEINCYTIFNAFHHFSTEEKNLVLSRLINSNCNFIIVELINGSLLNYIQVFINSILGQLIFTIFIKPFSLLRLFFTYVLPVNLFTVTFDGMISVAKSNYWEHIGKKHELEFQTINGSYFTKVYIIKNKSNAS
jgi:hypothetical protein